MAVASPYTIAPSGKVWVVRFSLTILSDPLFMQELSQSLAKVPQAEGFGGILLNMEGVKFIVSSFLNVVLKIDREMPADKRPIRVCCPSPSVRETFELTRLDKKFPLFADQASALAAFDKPSA